MEFLTFKLGIHPPERKEATEHLKVVKAVEPKTVIIPLQQHIGAPCEPLVKAGDTVKVGQRIGEPQGFVSSPVHSSVSGQVKEIAVKPSITGGEVVCVVIESDGLNEVHESIQPKGSLESLSSKEIIDIIKDAGIVGMGGATFPTHVKLSPPPEKKIELIILNGAECEPYLTSDHRLMLEQPQDIVFGLKAMMKACNVENAVIGIENNKMDAIQVMLDAVKDEPGIKVAALETKYPQGAEKQLIYSVTKKEVPSGGLPMDVGVIVNNVATAAAVANTIKTGMPLIERITTVAGKGITNPQNLLVKVGVSVKEVIEQCGGYAVEPKKLIMGGPMMGLAQYTDEISITKGSSGVIVFDEAEARMPEPSNCIRCGRCVSICPAFLRPVQIAEYSKHNMMEHAEKYRALDCIECGSCSYICPSKLPLLHSIRVAKNAIVAKKRKQKN
ncbi:electron transport complex subunit RsxC [Serpentinicella alkaliphila]|uniref:Ion-translocating oxidoreductase complex subunit C n=1 Tax=Serpentinicella alkaliphila TaxID=1734049 RepID=A0A4R2TCM7_9FIRM|nr:electron transport complex subunit RsxC [Serpentinicella alkaliphila]QUH26047.1 electron transport complex subunit RsxC [Serpentinicella alkaliphila]TCP99741.1 electron transport complex protein RnfC [Serpentinicella alkaliphila]